MLSTLITSAQNGNEDSMLLLLEKFDPLIKKYAYLAKEDDAESELTLQFITLIHNLELNSLGSLSDGVIVKYIAQSVRFAYIKLSKRYSYHNSYVNFFEDLNEVQKIKLSANLKEDTYLYMDNLFDSEVLTENERDIIKKIFIEQYTAAEVASALNISRQAVNQAKKRALTKLNTYLCSNTIEDPYSK